MASPNTLFADAIALTPSGGGGPITWDTVGLASSTLETGEPSQWHEEVRGQTWLGYFGLWYTYTSASDTVVLLHAQGPTGHFPLLSVWTGSAVNALSPVVYGTINSGGGYQARVQFEAQAGVTYRIKLGTWGTGTTNAGQLSWFTGTPPANDDFANAVLITGSSGSTSGDTTAATLEDVEPLLPYYTNDGPNSIWWKWVAPADGVAEFDLTGSAIDAIAALFRGTTLGGLVLVGTNDGWYDDTLSVGGEALVRARVVAGETYHLKVIGYGGEWGAVAVAWSLGAATVANDHYANAQVITGASGNVSGSLVDTSTEEGEPWLFYPGTQAADLGQLGGHTDYGGFSVWYEWTCPADGSYQFDTIGSDAWTLLGVFHDAPTLLDVDLATGRANDYGAGDTDKSLVTIRAEAGAVYKITVQGDYGAVGDFVLNWSTVTAPPNDNVADAIELVGSSGVISGTNIGASFEDGELRPLEGDPGGWSVWYKMDLNAWGWPTIDVGPSDWAIVALYTGPENATSVTQLTPALDNGEHVWDSGSAVGWASVPLGSNSPPWSGWLYIQVDSDNGLDNTFDLEWTLKRSEPELHYVGPPKVLTAVFVGYLEVAEGDRHLDIEYVYSGTGGVDVRVKLYEHPDLQIASPGNPGTNSSPSEWGGATVPDVYLLAGNTFGNELLGEAVDAGFFTWDLPGDTSGTTYRQTVRIPLPERSGLLTVHLSSGATMYVTEYHATVPDEVPRARNDDPSGAIDIGGGDKSTGEFVITPEQWAGATRQEGEPVFTDATVFGDDTQVPLTHGRTLWYRWVPEEDSDVLYFWWRLDLQSAEDDEHFSHWTDNGGPVVTAFTSVGDEWLYTYLSLIGTYSIDTRIDPIGWSFQYAIDPTYSANERWLAPQGSYDYVAIAARHDLADRVAGDPIYICVDLSHEMRIPPEDWPFGWFVHREGNYQAGPADLGIFSVGEYAGNDNDWWYVPGQQDQVYDAFWNDPSWTAVNGDMGPSLDLPHPFTETELGVGGIAARYVEYGDVDDDGIVYLPHETELGEDPTQEFPFQTIRRVGILAWEDGFLNLPVEDRFDDALAAAGVGGQWLQVVRIVGDEVWALRSSGGEEVMVRMSKGGDLIGIADVPPGHISWDLMLPVFGSRRRKFLTIGYASVPGLAPVAGFDTSAQHPRAFALAFSPDGTRMYVGGHAGDGDTDYYVAPLYQYGLSTPWRVDTAVYQGRMDESVGVYIGGVHPHIGSITFNGDGTTLYIPGTYVGAVNIYTLSTPYDITSGVIFNGWVNLDVYGGIVWKPDGTRFYEGSIDGIRQYTMSTPNAISTAAETASFSKTAYSIFINAAGTELSALRTSGGYIDVYAFATPWDLSSVDPTPIATYYVDGLRWGRSIWIDPNTGRYYIANDTVGGGPEGAEILELVPSAGVATPTTGVYDAVVGSFTPTNLPAGTWQSYDGGVVGARSGSSTIFSAATVPGAPVTDAAGTGWQTVAAPGGGTIAFTETKYIDVTVNVQWTGAMPGGIVFRYRDPLNYLVAQSNGLYRVVDGVKTLISAYNSGFVFGANTVMTVRDWNGGVNIMSSGGTTRYSATIGWHRTGPRTTHGRGQGVWASGGNVAVFHSFNIGSTTGTILLDVIGSDWENWGGTYRVQGWDIVNELLNSEDGLDGISPWFDTWSQNVLDVLVARDGKTAYLIRWWENYDANARDSRKYGGFTGNWIVTSVYAFDLETLTYIGKVGQYDVFPSFGHFAFYQTVYPYVAVVGDIDGGASNLVPMGTRARIETPTARTLEARRAAPAPTDRRRKSLIGPGAKPIPVGEATTMRWTMEGPVFTASIEPLAIDFGGRLLRVRLGFGDPGGGLTFTVRRDGFVVGEPTVVTADAVLELDEPWLLGETFAFSVDVAVGAAVSDLDVVTEWRHWVDDA